LLWDNVGASGEAFHLTILLEASTEKSGLFSTFQRSAMTVRYTTDAKKPPGGYRAARACAA
jgi:hypothetical protein